MQHLALSSFNSSSGKQTNTLSYSDLAHTAEETETFHFLQGETASDELPTVDILCCWSLLDNCVIDSCSLERNTTGVDYNDIDLTIISLVRILK